MGGGSSSYADLPKNEHLNRLVSKVTLNKFDTTNTKLFLLTLINHAGSAVSQWPFLEFSSFLQFWTSSFKVCTQKILICIITCFHRVDWREFDHFTEELQKRFLLSNLKTGNFVSLLKVGIFTESWVDWFCHNRLFCCAPQSWRILCWLKTVSSSGRPTTPSSFWG